MARLCSNPSADRCQRFSLFLALAHGWNSILEPMPPVSEERHCPAGGPDWPPPTDSSVMLPSGAVATLYTESSGGFPVSLLGC